jgi:hypothetical protein
MTKDKEIELTVLWQKWLSCACSKVRKTMKVWWSESDASYRKDEAATSKKSAFSVDVSV